MHFSNTTPGPSGKRDHPCSHPFSLGHNVHYNHMQRGRVTHPVTGFSGPSVGLQLKVPSLYVCVGLRGINVCCYACVCSRVCACECLNSQCPFIVYNTDFACLIGLNVNSFYIIHIHTLIHEHTHVHIQMHLNIKRISVHTTWIMDPL